MYSNEKLIKKADIALSDLSSNGGLLNPEQTNQFIRVLMESPTIFNSARIVTMTSPQKKINKIGFGSRILKPAVSATALSASDRSKPTTSQVELNTKEVIAEINIPYDVLEDNIEGGNVMAPMGASAGGLMDTIIQMIAERAALDLEELALLGDTTSVDPYLALIDGFLKLANVHTVNNSSATISKSTFKAGLKAMPPKYLRNRAAMAHYVSVNNETEYRDTLANRATVLGDANVTGANDLYSFGSKVTGVPLMPNDKGLFTNPLNLIFGMQRRINLEYDKDIRSRQFIIVLTARVDVAIEETDAIVKYYGIS